MNPTQILFGGAGKVNFYIITIFFQRMLEILSILKKFPKFSRNFFKRKFTKLWFNFNLLPFFYYFVQFSKKKSCYQSMLNVSWYNSLMMIYIQKNFFFKNLFLRLKVNPKPRACLVWPVSLNTHCNIYWKTSFRLSLKSNSYQKFPFDS